MLLKFLRWCGYKSITEVTPQIYISDQTVALNPDLLQKHHIQVVMNCSKNIPFVNSAQSGVKHHYRIPLSDDCTVSTVCDMTIFLRQYAPILNRHVSAAETVLIHCQCGMQRSASMLAALLMYRYKISAAEACKIIKSKRFVTFLPFPNFQLSLQMYEAYLKRTGHFAEDDKVMNNI